jgi:hypothetical protein
MRNNSPVNWPESVQAAVRLQRKLQEIDPSVNPKAHMNMSLDLAVAMTNAEKDCWNFDPVHGWRPIPKSKCL